VSARQGVKDTACLLARPTYRAKAGPTGVEAARQPRASNVRPRWSAQELRRTMPRLTATAARGSRRAARWSTKRPGVSRASRTGVTSRHSSTWQDGPSAVGAAGQSRGSGGKVSLGTHALDRRRGRDEVVMAAVDEVVLLLVELPDLCVAADRTTPSERFANQWPSLLEVRGRQRIGTHRGRARLGP
jgi:hypothetical protein